jgi:hypothetical protein
MYERKLEVDPITGEITKDGGITFSCRRLHIRTTFLQGQNYDAAKDVNDISDAPVMAHVIKIGKIHELAKGFSPSELY